MHKGKKMQYQKADDIFLVYCDGIGIVIPEKEMLLNYMHQNAESSNVLREQFCFDGISRSVVSSDKLQEFENVTLRKLEIASGTVYLVDDKMFKLFGKYCDYEICETADAVIAIHYNTREVIGIIALWDQET